MNLTVNELITKLQAIKDRGGADYSVALGINNEYDDLTTVETNTNQGWVYLTNDSDG